MYYGIVFVFQTIVLEIDQKDEQWRTVSRKFQSLIPELSGEDVESLMKTIKKEKGQFFSYQFL